MSRRIKVTVLGGSALATPLLIRVMGDRKAQRAYNFVLFGRNQERLDLVRRVCEEIVASYTGLDIQVSTSTSQQAAIAEADYCINQIRVGGLEGRAFDETFPRKFGIPGEETVGPGGFSNSLRGIPVVLDICRDIENLAPDAILLNLTNPSSIIQYAIRRYSKVKVIGTCDSPVSLMEMVADLLGYPRSELTFDLGGMHHFTWMTGVRHQGKDFLPEVLARADEMPKLGVDPELIRALNLLPSFYHKYYFHPDRVLAQTEGRPIRAHELMALSDQMLEDFRKWQPGTPPAMLSRRGAIWYEKIVVPTLLALAEQQTTELVLSVDNNGTLPWLPDDAIIEVPVQIENGEVVGARAPELPSIARMMTVQNCTYEMLAAQAIAEKDRDKALQALMTNHLVSNYNQARGILDLVWPAESRPRFIVQPVAKNDEKMAEMKAPRLFFGDHGPEEFNPPEEDYVLVTMEELWPKVKDRFKRQPASLVFVRDLDWYGLEAMERALPPFDLVVGLGGGVAQDAAKYLAWKRHSPVDEFVTITSVDASVTKSVAARAGGHVTYIGYILPRHVYIDFPLILSAPQRLNRSGVGDILCAHVALWDWEYARDRKGEAYDPKAAQAMRTWLMRVRDDAESIQKVSREGVRLIMEAFEDISLICRRFGSSRPQEGSEHTFAYNAEFQTGKHFLHGELVALGAWVMANLQDNTPEFLADLYARTGILWQPKDLGLLKTELIRILTTLNWYQKNFGRRFTILNERIIDHAFIEQIVAQLEFADH